MVIVTSACLGVIGAGIWAKPYTMHSRPERGMDCAVRRQTAKQRGIMIYSMGNMQLMQFSVLLRPHPHLQNQLVAGNSSLRPLPMIHLWQVPGLGLSSPVPVQAALAAVDRHSPPIHCPQHLCSNSVPTRCLLRFAGHPQFPLPMAHGVAAAAVKHTVHSYATNTV